MSRLDDELRIAFERKQPPADFVARVLERINETPAPKKNWRERLTGLFEPPKLRWVAIAVAASLLVAIGVAQYYGIHETPVEQVARQPMPAPALEAGQAVAKKDDGVVAAESGVVANDAGEGVRGRDVAPPYRRVNKRYAAPRSALNQVGLAGAAKGRAVSAEAEAAKERVLFALQIVDSTLTDARRVIQEDSRKSRPGPSHNR
ncbi:MAG TPA: hypothetical protein VNI02_21890 [Blastocatellia bacterium]|jgi:hypothetical protein|nr:hypothetical protein [Blastocatellia bacterium]